MLNSVNCVNVNAVVACDGRAEFAPVQSCTNNKYVLSSEFRSAAHFPTIVRSVPQAISLISARRVPSKVAESIIDVAKAHRQGCKVGS